MFAAHLASGLAIRTAEPKAPAWALLTAAFLPDFFWIGLARIGIEPADGARFFDGWSHSAASVLIQALCFSLCFAAFGRRVMLAIGIAVISHFLLDLPIHPEPLELWPHAPWSAGPAAWAWGQATWSLGKSHYWWIQFAIVVALLTAYGVGARRQKHPSPLIAASCLVVLGVHLMI